jgi:hypothetical protein
MNVDIKTNHLWIVVINLINPVIKIYGKLDFSKD